MDGNTPPCKPSWYPNISSKLQSTLRQVAPLDKVVLLCPEANTSFGMSSKFWEKLVKKYQRKGYSVVTNAVKPQNDIKGSIHLDMSLSDAVALAMKCAKVHALRSGFTDLIFEKGRDLTVYYSTLQTMSAAKSLYVFSLNKLWVG